MNRRRYTDGISETATSIYTIYQRDTDSHPMLLSDWCYYNNTSVIHCTLGSALIKPSLWHQIQMIFYSVVNLRRLSPFVGVCYERVSWEQPPPLCHPFLSNCGLLPRTMSLSDIRGFSCLTPALSWQLYLAYWFVFLIRLKIREDNRFRIINNFASVLKLLQRIINERTNKVLATFFCKAFTYYIDENKFHNVLIAVNQLIISINFTW